MKFLKLLLTVTFASLTFSSAHSQNITASSVNFGNGNIFVYTSGTGSPTGSCTGVATYIQTDSTGSPLWVCKAGTWTQTAQSQPGGSTGQVQYSLGGSFGGTSGFSFSTATTPNVETVPQLLANWGIEDIADGLFSDLGTEHHGGVSNPTVSTGDALQQTLIDAECWSIANNNHAVKVIVSALYPISGTNIQAYANEDVECSVLAPHTYTAFCKVSQTNTGNNTATGGATLFSVIYNNGVTCNGTTSYPGAEGVTLNGFYMYGGGFNAGGGDIGVTVSSNSVSVQNTEITGFFGGPAARFYAGVNDSFDWNYATNVDGWFRNNPTSLPSDAVIAGHVGALDWAASDSEISNNQYSTGIGFALNFHVGAEYPYIAVFNIAGAGNLVFANLLQTDEVAVSNNGIENRYQSNRFEYMARELIQNNSSQTRYMGNMLTSGCLDSNLQTDSQVCNFVTDYFTAGGSYVGNTSQVESAVDGPSYASSCYAIEYPLNPPELQTNTCYLADTQAYPKFYPFNAVTNSAATGIPTNGEAISASGGTLAWVGDYQTLLLTDTTAQGYYYFPGASTGSTFYIIATAANDIIYNSGTAGFYGHPGTVTCDGNPIVMTIGQSYAFYANGNYIQPANCMTPTTAQLKVNYYGQTSPTASTVGAFDAFGNLGLRYIPQITAPTLNTNQAPAGSYTYCYITEAWAEGAHFTSTADVCTSSKGVLTSSAYIGISPQNIPNNWEEVRVYRYSTTSGLQTGLIADLFAGQSLGANDTGQTPTSTTLPSSLGIDTSARALIAPTLTPSTGTTDCVQGQVWIGADGNLYVCTATNTVGKVTVTVP